MAKKIKVSKGAVFFLEGDVNNGKSYLLTQGEAVRTHHDVDGEFTTQEIGVGNFFGLTSALAETPRDETVEMLSDCVIVELSLSELYSFLEKDIKTLLRLLVYFSNKMLEIHKTIESKLSLGNTLMSEEDKLHLLAMHYNSRGDHLITRYILNRFLDLYPDHDHAGEMRELLAKVERLLELA